MAFGDLKVQDLIYEDSSNNEVTVVIADLATKNNPTFTGTVTVPTAPASDVSTKAASTAFVDAYYATKAAPAFTGSATGVNLTLSGNLVVNGTTTTINTQTLDVEDHNITLGKVSTPSDTTANNGGLTLKGASDKTFNWLNATDAWTSSEHLHLLNTKNLILGTDSHSTLSYLHGSSTTRLINRNTYIEVVDDGTAAGSIKLAVDGGNQFFINERGFVAPALGTVGMQWAPAVNQDTVLGVRGRGSNTSNLAVVDLTSSHGSVSGADVKYGKIRFSWDNTSWVSDNGTAIIEGCSGAASSSSDRATALKFYTAPTGSAGSYAALPVERLRIWKDGQIGIGGANYGSSGQVLTSGGSGAAPSWAAVPPGGNTFTAVANGAIANNKAVKIDTDGKVSQIASTSVRNTSPTRGGSASENGIDVSSTGENAEDCKVTWIGSNKMLVTWIKDNYPSSGKMGVKGVVGTWNTAGYFTNWGSEFQMCANTRRARYDVDWDATNDTILFSYADVDDNSKGKTAFIKVSGTTLSFISSGQTPRVWRNSSDTRSIRTTWDDSIERLILMYQAGSGQGVHSVVMQKNSSDDSYASTYAGDESSNNPVVDDDCAICSLTSGKAIAFWNSTDGNFYYMIGVVNTSNNTISWGSKVQAKGDEQMYCDCAYNPDKSIVMFVGRHTGGFNRCTPHFTEFNNSNNTLGSWSATYMDNNQSESHCCVYDPDSEAFHIAFLMGGSPNNVRHRSIYHSTTTASSYSVTNGLPCFSGNYSWLTRMAAAPGLGTITFAAYSGSRVRSQNVVTTTMQSNLTDGHHYVGYADQAYTNGQTATIKTTGNVVETLSGLTAGTKYYVQGDGTLGTSAGSPSCLAGLALSSSKLLIREGKSDV